MAILAMMCGPSLVFTTHKLAPSNMVAGTENKHTKQPPLPQW